MAAEAGIERTHRWYGSRLDWRISTWAALRTGACALFAVLASVGTSAAAIDLPGVTSAKLEWTASTGPVSGYRVYVSRNGAAPTTHEQSVTATDAVVSGVAGESIEVWVQAFASGGLLSAASARSEMLRFTSVPAAVLDVQPATLASSGVLGADASERTLSIRNAGAGSMGWSVSTDAAWLVPMTPAGASTGETDMVTLRFESGALAVGTYTATVTVSAADAAGDPKTVVVSLQVTAPPALEVSLPELVRAVAARHRPTNQIVTVRNGGAGTLAWTASSDAAWLVPTPGAGTTGGENDEVALQFVTEGLAPGEHVTTLRFGSAGAPDVVVPVTVRVRPPTGDVDGDGSSEAFLWGPGGMVVYSHPLESSSTLSAVVASGSPEEWVVLVSGDFDRDGRSDLLWRNRESGEIYVCLMEAASFRSCGSPLHLSADRVVIGAGDLDADGRADVSFRNPVSGALEACFMDGLEPATCTTLGIIPPSFQVLTNGDWDGDGKADVVAHDPAGSIWLCPIQGRMAMPCTSRSAPIDVRLLGLGDYDGDGGADLLWHRQADDQLLLGYPDASGMTLLGVVPDDVEVVASLDLDGDGTSEVAFRRPSDGGVVVWKTHAGGVEQVFDFGPIAEGLTLVGSSPVQ